MKNIEMTPRGLTILPRHDLEENWLKHNPVLRDREIAVSVDKNEIGFKLGDGKTPYSERPFVDLFKAIMLGYVYVSEALPYERAKLQLFDGGLWERLKEYPVIWDKHCNILIRSKTTKV